jgi:magnesium-transporting ATPase (P-type)
MVWLLRTAALCNSAVLQQDESGQWEAIGDSTDVALQLMAAKVGYDKPISCRKAGRFWTALRSTANANA